MSKDLEVLDARGMPARHEPAEDFTPFLRDHQGPPLVRYNAASYTELPNPPAPVKAAKDKMDKAAELVEQLDEAADGLLAEYKAAPKKAAKAARDAVASGKTPASSAKLDKELDRIALAYRDAVAHRKAVESHLIRLIDEYHKVAEAHLPAWRDQLAAELEARTEPARVALAKALSDAREVYDLAFHIEDMDRPGWGRYDRPRVSALKGRELPEVFRIDATRGGNDVEHAPDRSQVDKDLDAAARVATVWLRVEGNEQLGQGAIPEALTLPVSDLPVEDAEAVAAERAHREKQRERWQELGLSEKRARAVFGF